MESRLFTLIAVCMLLAGCSKDIETTIPDGFIVDKMLRMTPIKDQGQSNLCWAFAMLATIETEHLEQGDSVNLSTNYVARKILEEQAEEYYTSNGKSEISMRGTGPMLLRLIRKYGILAHDSYYSHTPINFNALQKKLKITLDRNIAQHHSWEQCRDDIATLLDKEIGALPRCVFMLGAEYTPLEFAHSVYRKDEYQAFCTNDKKEYGTLIDPELTDNRYHQKATNIPADSLTQRAISSIEANHPVFWEGGPNDAHAVSLIGIGHDAEGKRYFIAKNSWGTDNPTQGLLYISTDYITTHTTLMVVQADL